MSLFNPSSYMEKEIFSVLILIVIARPCSGAGFLVAEIWRGASCNRHCPCMQFLCSSAIWCFLKWIRDTKTLYRTPIGRFDRFLYGFKSVKIVEYICLCCPLTQSCGG